MTKVQSNLPTPKFIQHCFNVSEKFLSVYKPGNTVNFSCSMVYTTPECKTIACHGGWAAVLFIPDFNPEQDSFIQGADALARYLGFPRADALEHWAHHNYKIWGNNHGALMFYSGGSIAFQTDGDFRYSPFEPITLYHIAEKWAKVGERLLNEYKKSLAEA